MKTPTDVADHCVEKVRALVAFEKERKTRGESPRYNFLAGVHDLLKSFSNDEITWARRWLVNWDHDPARQAEAVAEVVAA